jgi:hypothetical protein
MSCSSAGAPESFSNSMQEMPTETTATDARTRSRSGASGPASRSRRVSNCDPATVRSLPAAVQHDVYVAIAYAIHGVFLWAIPASALAFALAWFIKEVPLRGRTVPGDAETTAPELVA